MAAVRAPANNGFCHEALLYRGETEFLEGALPFLRDGLESDEPMLVVVSAPKIAALRTELDDDAGRIQFADMAEVGHNPARIIPAWRAFLDEHGGGTRPVRGIGEPIWAGQGPDQLVERQRHESLLNVAFAGSGSWWLLCSYDTDALDPAVVEEAERSHPHLTEHGARRPSSTCRDLDAMAAPFDVPLPPSPSHARPHTFRGPGSLAGLRIVVSERATEAGLAADRVAELVVAVNEAATNSICHADGEGTLRVWDDGDAVVCELRDRGQIDHPLAGRERPTVQQAGGRGLWMATQLCDLVQLRRSESGNVVRLHMRHEGQAR
jgi:anti-sigma regulatory factor (Ser/Thr protein kinase)